MRNPCSAGIPQNRELSEVNIESAYTQTKNKQSRSGARLRAKILTTVCSPVCSIYFKKGKKLQYKSSNYKFSQQEKSRLCLGVLVTLLRRTQPDCILETGSATVVLETGRVSMYQRLFDVERYWLLESDLFKMQRTQAFREVQRFYWLWQ